MSRDERAMLRKEIEIFVQHKALCPPVTLSTLEMLSDEFFSLQIDNESSVSYRKTMKEWMMVEIHNQIWMETVAGIPYDRRLLLLPKCLSCSKGCEAEMDEFGLLCHQCGRCNIPNLENEAERLGVMSIVAEGFTSVIELIENRVVDAVIGVSCLDSLEKAFPLLVNHAVPGLAIPLNKSGCKDTDVDYDYVKRVMSKRSGQVVTLLDYDKIKSTVNEWFSSDNLDEWFDASKTAQIAKEWLMAGGKRWRPFLLTAVYESLTLNSEVEKREEKLPDCVRKAALAVECFHKASLVHDDIEDEDLTRYDKPTVYGLHGCAVAINVGDYLLGLGYRLLSSCGMPDLIQAIADAHVRLCEGQGTELMWTNGTYGNMDEMSLDEVIGIFERKTVPAFQVALEMGLMCAGQGKGALMDVMKRFSRALGVGYQLQDDLDDSVADNSDRKRLSVMNIIKDEEKVKAMVEDCRKEALSVLSEVDCVELKRLLFMIVNKI